MRRKSGGSQPADHHCAECERGCLHSHLQGKGIAHVEEIPHAFLFRPGLPVCVGISDEPPAPENVEGEACQHYYSGEQGAESGSCETELRTAELSVYENPVAGYVKEVASEEEEHRDHRGLHSVGELLEQIEAEDRDCGYAYEKVVWPDEGQEFRVLAEMAEEGVYPQDNQGGHRAESDIDSYSVAQCQPDAGPVPGAVLGSDYRCHSHCEAELDENEEVHHVVHESGGGQLRYAVPAYHDVVGEGHDYDAGLSEHYGDSDSEYSDELFHSHGPEFPACKVT